MSDQSANLALPFLAAAQAQKHVTVNETLTRLDALVQLTAVSATTTAQPASPADGAVYIIPSGKTGAAWSTMDDHALAYFRDGAWEEIAPREGWCTFIADTDTLLAWNGAAWVSPSLQNAPLLGVNASADTTNRLSIASAASLFSHAGAGHQHKINKAAASDTASIMLQTAFSGRAELGLAGDDHFRIKVSADGSTWHDALFVDKSNARHGIGTSAPTSLLTVSANAAAAPTPPTGTLAHLAGADAANVRVVLDAFAGQPLLNFRRANTTNAAPSALQNNDNLGGFNWFGYGATAYSSNSRLELSGLATENWSDTAQGCALRALTCPNGSTTKAERFRIDQDGALTIRANAQVLVDANGLVGLRSYTVTTLPSAVT